MKAITIQQPWASLIAIGAKRMESFRYAPKYTGPLAIHASGRPVRPFSLTRPVRAALEAAGLSPGHLPHGRIVAIVELTKCVVIAHPWTSPELFAASRAIEMPGPPECDFGEYRMGRFAWVFGSVQMLSVPVPARGQLGMWDWTPPEELVR